MPTTDRQPGVFYAEASNGVELPVVDVTHPAFALNVTDAELARLSDQFVREAKQRKWMPIWLLRAVYWTVLRRSRIASGIMGASAGRTFLSGMNTYLLKLGPDNLGDLGTPVDRKIASSVGGLSTRLRLQDVAHLLAQGLAPRMAQFSRQPLQFVNVGGGPAIDSVNAILLLHRDHPRELAGRRIRIDVLDLDTEGFEFGRRAVAALSAGGAPLQGISIDVAHTRYDWNRSDELPDILGRILLPDSLAAVSSEGALFEYGSDEAIVSNLEILRSHTPAGTFIAGSVTRDDGPGAYTQHATRIPTRPRSHDQFNGLATRAGWRIAQVIERPFGRNVALVKEA
jgi:hypothetical protein